MLDMHSGFVFFLISWNCVLFTFVALTSGKIIGSTKWANDGETCQMHAGPMIFNGVIIFDSSVITITTAINAH